MLPVTLTAYHAAADQNLHRARASLCSAHVNHLPLMLLNICWIAPIQAVSCNYRAKQGLCSRGNKVSLWEGPQTSSCLYNRKCWRPFRSCWHACRRVHTPHMAPLGIPKACSDIQYFCSFTEYLLRHSSLRDTVSVIHWIPVSQWRFSHSHRQNNVGAEQQRSEAGISINPLVFIPCTTSPQLSCSLQLDLDQHASKKGSSAKSSASYTQAAHYNCTLREGV